MPPMDGCGEIQNDLSVPRRLPRPPNGQPTISAARRAFLLSWLLLSVTQIGEAARCGGLARVSGSLVGPVSALVAPGSCRRHGAAQLPMCRACGQAGATRLPPRVRRPGARVFPRRWPAPGAARRNGRGSGRRRPGHGHRPAGPVCAVSVVRRRELVSWTPSRVCPRQLAASCLPSPGPRGRACGVGRRRGSGRAWPYQRSSGAPAARAHSTRSCLSP
jgi:hypothetical protein